MDNSKQSNTKLKVNSEKLKASYASPHLRIFGSIKQLTQTGQGTGADGGLDATMTMVSDRNAKRNIVQVGRHPLGMGLYLFDYKLEFQEFAGGGRQFGVMADEVETVVPEAVIMHPDGYKQVDYAMLGIDFSKRHAH